MSIYPTKDLDTRPLTTWPGQRTPSWERCKANYTASLDRTLEALQVELRALQAQHPVLEVAIPADQWRIDGRPRAGAKAEHPGVVLSLPTTAAGPLRFACDRYTT